MSASQQTKRAWVKKLTALAQGLDRAKDDALVGVYEATENGLSHADIARAMGDKSASGIPAKAAKGREVLERRKRGLSTP